MSALNIKKGSSSHSAYDLRDPNAPVNETHTLAVLVDNESGVLARVIGLFSGRGYNIESLTVAEVDHQGHRSRITVVTTGTPQVIDQIKAQLARMVPVHEVHDLTVDGPSVQRELALFKVAGRGEHRTPGPDRRYRSSSSARRRASASDRVSGAGSPALLRRRRYSAAISPPAPSMAGPASHRSRFDPRAVGFSSTYSP